MIMDNIEMGEIEFTHHGVYSHAWFHWYSRGFSPLAIELLNARRTLDYLSARDDIDRHRIGATNPSPHFREQPKPADTTGRATGRPPLQVITATHRPGTHA